MTWLLTAIIAYFLFAVSTVIDKTLLKKDIPEPVVYTFYIAILGAVLMLAIIPFGFSVPNALIIFVSLIAGAVFVWALILMFTAFKKDDISRVAPMIGGLVPIFVLGMASFALKEKLTCAQYISFIFLIAGTFLISLDFQKHGAWHWVKKKFGLEKRFSIPHIRKIFWVALPAAVLFAVTHVLTKFVYSNTEFLTGFIWIRLGAFLTVMGLLISTQNREKIFKNLKKNKKKKSNAKKVGGRFLFGQMCGGAGTLLQQYAIFLGSVSLINALQGIQYAFVFLIVLILTIFLPKILKEEFSKEIFWQKVVAVGLIFIGLYFVTI